MKIRSMFAKDINRDINGVVKVAQDDERSLSQELSEYIITRELRRHFRTFFDHYAKALDAPTDQIGVWISGFFGSGKSHFLKMLSCLLSNRVVAGRPAIDYFADKFDDPMMYADAVRCASAPTEAILFNIDVEGPINKDKTAVLRVFAKTFYNHCGYYGDDLKLAKLERFIDRQGKGEAFRQEFARVNGQPWAEARDSAAFFEDDVVAVLQTVLGMSETAARNWFNGEETNELSIAQLVEDIRAYVDGKGKNFRLLFMVDEVGQYIGDDGDLMINLQSLVEEIGTRCRGQVWVMVTSQEAIDSVVKIAGDDFSKIQGRFNTRLSLSSSSVDEVIQKRVLAKTDEAAALLRMEYDRQAPVLKNLFTFSNNRVLDIKGFSGAEEFAAAFPFVPYQFLVIQKVLAEIRKHGNAGKHLSGGERSMLSGFQEAAQQVQDRDENALVPFYRFYDTVSTFLESPIRRVIDRCQNAADHRDGLEPEDVAVLKLLYLIRYIDDINANIDNIAVLMIDDIRTDKIALRAQVAAALERLQRQNYVSRSGDAYAFLTDEEQEIAIDIRRTAVDTAQVVASIAQTVFGEIYPAKKVKYGRYDFPYDQYVDETLNGTACGGIRLRLVTVAGDLYGVAGEQLVLESQRNREALVLLSDEAPYFEELEQAMKIRKYARQKNVSQLAASVQAVIHSRMQEARALEDRARASIEKAILSARVIVCGEELPLRAGSAKDKLDAAMHALVETVYTKLNMVNRFADSDADILAILNGAADAEQTLPGSGANNEEALHEISQWLELQADAMRTTSMRNVQDRYQAIPYGWREIDIAALVARLVAQQKLSIQYGGAVVGKGDRRLPDYLRKRTETERALVVRRVAPSEELMRKCVAFLREYLGKMDVPGDEDGLVAFVQKTFTAKRDACQALLDGAYAKAAYPQKAVVEAARALMQDMLGQSRDDVALLEHLLKRQDDLLDSAEDMEDIEAFFRTQRPTFDAARALADKMTQESDYLTGSEDAAAALHELRRILALEKPYREIGRLPEAMDTLKRVYAQKLDLKRGEVAETIRQCMADVHTLAAGARDAQDLLREADAEFTRKKQEAAAAASLVGLDAMITRLDAYKRTVCSRLADLAAPPAPAQPAPADGAQPAAQPLRYAPVDRRELCPARRLRSKAEVDRYLEEVRARLYEALEDADGVQVL